MGRLELVALGDKTDEENMEDAIRNLESFDINEAHCFDPNEERKLRIIMANIGIKRLKNGLNDSAKMLRGNKNSNKGSAVSKAGVISNRKSGNTSSTNWKSV